jgi:threonine dehydratase
LAAPFAGENALPHIRAYVDDVIIVSDDDIAAALRLTLERTKILTEPAGAAAVAALLSGRLAIARKRVAVIASGGNVDLSRLRELLV